MMMQFLSEQGTQFTHEQGRGMQRRRQGGYVGMGIKWVTDTRL